ncbi:MAG: DUF2807 domain-containing protein [Chitinophagaceae bacterium]|nr:DUF2807 domain-containing protein [Chitinophagaceae bacterium]
MKLFFAILAFSVLTLSSCHYFHGKRIDGNGHVVSQPRSISNFDAVDVSSAIHLYIKQDSFFSVKVETDENLQQYIIVGEDKGTLYIKQEDNTSLDATGKIKVYVSAPVFKSVEASGACQVKGEGTLSSPDGLDVRVSGASGLELDVETPKVTADMSGASNITLRGKTRDLFIKGGGASHAKCFDLLSENADVDVSGASNADVSASVKLDAEASGASDIRYKGSPSVHENKSGAGNIKKVD